MRYEVKVIDVYVYCFCQHFWAAIKNMRIAQFLEIVVPGYSGNK